VIAGIPPIAGLANLPAAAPVARPAGAGDFGSALAKGLDTLQGLQSTSDNLAVKAATGDLTDVHDYMIAANEATVATQLTVAVRNKAVEAFTEIMRMQM
jgi:flagellar hook-basal body complex protein FliE